MGELAAVEEMAVLPPIFIFNPVELFQRPAASQVSVTHRRDSFSVAMAALADQAAPRRAEIRRADLAALVAVAGHRQQHATIGGTSVIQGGNGGTGGNGTAGLATGGAGGNGGNGGAAAYNDVFLATVTAGFSTTTLTDNSIVAGGNGGGGGGGGRPLAALPRVVSAVAAVTQLIQPAAPSTWPIRPLSVATAAMVAAGMAAAPLGGPAEWVERVVMPAP